MPGLKTELRTVKPGEHYELEVTLVPPLPEKPMFKDLTLQTGFPEAPTVAVRVYAKMAPRVVAKPPYFRVPAKRDSGWAQRVHVEWNDKKAPHKVLSASVADPKLTVEVKEENGTQWVVLSGPEDYAPRSHSRSVAIKTDDAKEPVLTVPIIVTSNRRPHLKSGTSRGRLGRARAPGKGPHAANLKASKLNAAKPNAAKQATPKPDNSKPETPKQDSGGR